MVSPSVARPSSGSKSRSSSTGVVAQPKAFAAAAQVAIKGTANKQLVMPTVARSAATNLSNPASGNTKKALASTALKTSAGSRFTQPRARSQASATRRNSSVPAGPQVAALNTKQQVDGSQALNKGKPAECCIFSMADAEKMLKALKPADLAAFAKSSDVVEQTPACIMLDFVGDDNLSWSNAQASLAKWPSFLKEILGMHGDSFITKRTLERMGKAGLDVASLQGKNQAAFAFGAYLDACLRSAKERLGVKSRPPTPLADEEPTLWPMKVAFKDINGKAEEAARHGKTALFVCNGHAEEVDTFFAYRGGGCTVIEAQSILNKVSVSKVVSVEAARTDMHRRVESSMVHGKAVCISMGRTALDFQNSYCGKDELPACLFNNRLMKSENPEAADGFYTFLTTNFNLESAQEHLSKALPHFDEMAIIEVDPSSFEA